MPRLHHRPPSRARRCLPMVVVVGLVVVGGCVPGDASEFGAEVERDFLAACTSGQTSGESSVGGSEEFCQCVYDGIVNGTNDHAKVTFESFKAFDEAQAEAEEGEIEVPQNIANIQQDCQADTGAALSGGSDAGDGNEGDGNEGDGEPSEGTGD